MLSSVSMRGSLLRQSLIGFSLRSADAASALVYKPTFVEGSNNDLGVRNTVSNATPTVGQQITYTVTASNNNDLFSTQGVQVLDRIPTGTTYVSSTSGETYDPNTGVWSVGTLAGGVSRTLNVTVAVNSDGPITSTATISSPSNADPTTANNTATATANASAAPTTPPPTNTPCYCTGTRILTDRGEVSVEDLAVGDTVVTVTGEHRPIRWIGTRSYLGRFANTNPAVLPVCVRAGALADGVPARDLWLSPNHALLLDGLLVPVELLVDGAGITRAARVESVAYWHVELDDHDVLVAEGAAAESFVDDQGRAIFQNAASYRAMYPGAAPTAAVYCAPRVADDGVHGYALEAIRRRLALRAGLPVSPARVFGALRGHLDPCNGRRVTGWAQDTAHADGPVCLDVVVDGTVVALVYAEEYRADLEAAGVGDGRHAFDLELSEALDPGVPHSLVVRRSVDGAIVGTQDFSAGGIESAAA